MIQQFYPQTNHNYIYELNKDFHIAAAHFIPSEKSGKCANLHGHTYFVNITIVGNELDETRFLVDFSVIKRLIHDKLDHTTLNDHVDSFPTTEIVARWIHDVVQSHLENTENKPKCLQVIVRETPSSYVVYRGSK